MNDRAENGRYDGLLRQGLSGGAWGGRATAAGGDDVLGDAVLVPWDPSSGVDGSSGGLLVDPDVELRTVGAPISIRHVYNSIANPLHTPLGEQWNLSLYGDYWAGAGLMIRRTHGGIAMWMGGRRYAGQYNTIETVDGHMAERSVDGRVGLYEQYASDPPHVFYGHIIASRDLNGNQIDFNYDAGNYLSRVDGPCGRAIYFEYGGDGRMDSMTDWAGRTQYYEHDDDGNLTRQIGPTGCITDYTYDDTHHMTSTTDPDGYTTYYEFDEQLRLRAITAPSGGQLHYHYSAWNSYITDPFGRVTYYTYNAHQYLTGIYTPGGKNEVYDVDDFHRLRSVTDSNGHETSFGTDYYGNRTSVYAPGRYWGFSYSVGNSNGNTMRHFTDPLGRMTYYGYDECANRISELDPLGFATYYEYDSHGQMTAVTDKLGQTAQLGYDAYGNRTWVQDPLANTSYFHHDQAGNVIAATDPLGASTYYEYDAMDRVTKLTDPLGRVTEHAYDGRGNRTITLQPDGSAVYYEYDALSNQTRRVDQLLHSWTSHYDLMRKLTASTDPLGNTAYYLYDENYRVVASLDPRGYPTYYEYDRKGNRTQVTDALGHTTYFWYNEVDENYRVVDAKGGHWDTIRDAAGQVRAIIDPLGRGTYFGYDDDGRQVWTETAAGTFYYYEYDRNGRVTASADPIGSVAYYLYDAAGRQTEALDAMGQQWQTFYDADRRITCEANPLGQRSYYEYDSSGNVTVITDPAGYSTYYHYDLLDQMDRLTDATGQQWETSFDALGRTRCSLDPLGNGTYFEYDDASRLTAATAPLGQTSYYEYDEDGRLQALTDPLGRTWYYQYDALGNVVVALDPLGHPTYYAYDELGRLLTCTDAVGHVETRHYDSAGQLIQFDRASGVGAYYTYDALGGVIREVRYPSGDAIYYQYDTRHVLTSARKTGVQDQAWEYDRMGRVVHLAQGAEHLYYQYDAAGGRSQLALKTSAGTYFDYYSRDTRGLLQALTDPWGQTVYYEYDALGRATKAVLPDGVTSYHEYDAAGRATSVLHVGPGGLLQAHYYTYDANSRPVAITREDGTSIELAYDDAGQLTAETWRGNGGVVLHSFAYRYDNAGNRLQLTQDGVTTYYSYNSLHQLQVAASTAGDVAYYTWQADGALATRQQGTTCTYFTWDVDGSLVRIETPQQGGAEVLVNTYDAWMRRLTRVHTPSGGSGAASYFVYDGAKLLRRNDVADGILASTHYLNRGASVYSSLVAEAQMAGDEITTLWHLYDRMGTTAGLADEAGALAATRSCDAFGNAVGSSGAADTSFWYIGALGYYDEAFGQQQLWRRWYDPTVGRFESRDPLGAIGAGRYAYAANAPTRFVDPTGLAPTRGGAEPGTRIHTPGLGSGAPALDCGRLQQKANALAHLVFPPNEPFCHLLNDVLYEYLSKCRGFSAPRRNGPYPWPAAPAPPVIPRFGDLPAYWAWWTSCHCHAVPYAPPTMPAPRSTPGQYQVPPSVRSPLEPPLAPVDWRHPKKMTDCGEVQWRFQAKACCRIWATYNPSEYDACLQYTSLIPESPVDEETIPEKEKNPDPEEGGPGSPTPIVVAVSG